MIIKSILRRYEGWNPVHPTYGAFWGIGVGIGCGVGWGPGFGPEVIGYVGSGCGLGFSIGITFLGLGIGLPANDLLTAPHNGFKVARRGITQARDLLGNRSHVGDDDRGGMINLPEVKSMLVSPGKHIVDCLQRVNGRFFPLDKGMPK